MIDGSEKHNRQLAFELQNSLVMKSAICKETLKTEFILEVYLFDTKINCAYLARASLNSLYIPLSVLPVVEIRAALA